MKTKTCTRCGIDKPVKEFNKDKNRKNKLYPWCKDCRKKYKKEYYEENKEMFLKKNENYRDSHKEKIKEYKNTHKESHKKYMKEYYQSHKEEILNCMKERYQENKQGQNEYQKQRRKTDLNYKIRCYLGSRISIALKRNIKSLPTMFLIGCEVEYLMHHLQNQFTKGMNWDNYGKWHIDHIKPCALFDLSKPSEQRKCFNYKNLQPLWAPDNLKKGSKYKEEKL